MLFFFKVLLTITAIFLIAEIFTSTSTTIVALLHNITNLHINYIFDNWTKNFNCVKNFK